MKVRALNLGFKATDGKHHTLKLNNVSTNLDESKLREAMNKLVELDMFQDKFGTKLYERQLVRSILIQKLKQFLQLKTK